MVDVTATEEEIRAPENLSAKGEFAAALALSQNMLNRVHDDETRIRLLFNVVICSTALGVAGVTEDAIAELEKLPNSKISSIGAVFFQAVSHLALGRAQEALDLIEANLKSEFLEREDFQIWKYEHLAYQGRALAYLARCEESLAALAQAHQMYPEGNREADILVDQANCMMALKQYEEAYVTASQVQHLDNGELATLALQYMAECRMWQGRVQESLELYRDLLKKLPCRLVKEERIQAGINNGMAYLERCRPYGKPF
jgi:tetratricopeptide (TPR) repeat protein